MYSSAQRNLVHSLTTNNTTQVHPTTINDGGGQVVIHEHKISSFMYLVSDLEASGSATRRQLEELQELTKGISTIISSHTLAELQSEHWKVVDFQTPEAPLTCPLLPQEAELVAMATRLAAGESQREALESRLDAEEAALETLKTESSGIAYIRLATAYISTQVQSVAIAYISIRIQSSCVLEGGLRSTQSLVEELHIQDTELLSGGWLQGSPHHPNTASPPNISDHMRRSVSLGSQQLSSLLPDHTSQLLRVETRVNISQSLLEHLKTQQNTGTPAEVQLTDKQEHNTDLEATGSATRRQLEELQELIKGISTIIPSRTLAELQSEHWKVVDFQTPEAPLTSQEAELVAMAARLATGESQREALESRLDAEEAALDTLKTESSGIASISTQVQSVAVAYISTRVQSGYVLEDGLRSTQSLVEELHIQDTELLSGGWLQGSPLHPNTASPPNISDRMRR
ncbi:hypothetical protein N1851_022340 [Merluccius polli]|uniref:Uncharacterized protein n=1 Tax=Merluccius polli TaxID=89951 RepID=A0AA47MIB3_MERPO|nr:hypothetical protein N1851_022340 [Merluccius polli]